MNDNWKQVSDDEKEMSISDMLFYLLRQWKVAVIAALIGLLLVGGLTYAKSLENAKKSASNSQTTQAGMLTEEEEFAADVKIDTINEYKQNIEEYNEYLDNSIRMKLDPNGFYRGTIKFMFTSESPAAALKALNVCSDLVFNNENYEKMTQLLTEEISEAYVREAFTFEKETMSNEKSSENVIVWDVSFVHYEQEECEKIVDYIDEQMNNVMAQLDENVVAEQVGRDVYLACYVDLIKESMSLEVGKSSVYTSMEKVKADMSNTEKAYYELSTSSGEQTEAVNTEVVPVKASVQWKYAVLAAVGAGGCVIVFCAALYLFGNLVHNKEELEVYTNVPVIGLSAKKTKKNVIDHLIDRLEHCVRNGKEDTIDMAATMLCNYAVQNHVKRIYLSGAKGEHREELMAQFNSRMEKEKIELIGGNSILEDVKAISDAVECGSVVFLEKSNKTSHRDLREELRKAGHCELKVLGIILEK